MNNNTRKFELFRCCLGNGITVCNKATTEYGDYKTIAHISDRGHLKLYVSDDYIPAEAMEIIKRDAEEQRKKFAIYWNALSLAERYGKILDSLPIAKMLEVVKAKRGIAATVEEMTPYYMDIH